MHPCEIVYNIGANNKIYGQTEGVCRITGNAGVGLPFNKWVKPTFTDHAYLKPGTIISNEALFCFDENSEIVQTKVGKEKKQRFRTYSHIVYKGKWYCKTKGDKKEIYNMIVNGAELVCLTDSGQKHMLFKHRPGMWQLDEMYVIPNIAEFKKLHNNMCAMLDMEFSQKEIISGHYLQYRIKQIGIKEWLNAEFKIKSQRGKLMFNLAAWLLFKSE